MDARFVDQLAGWVIAGDEAGPAGVVVVDFADGSLLTVDRLALARPIELFLSARGGTLDTIAEAIALRWFGTIEMPRVSSLSDAHAATRRAFGRVALAQAHAIGRNSLWWADAALALVAIGEDRTALRAQARGYAERAAPVLTTLIEIASAESGVVSRGLGALLPLCDTMIELLGLDAPDAVVTFSERLGGAHVPPVDERAVARFLERESEGHAVRRPRTESLGAALGDLPSTSGLDDVPVDIDLPLEIVRDVTCRRIDSERCLLTLRLLTDWPNLTAWGRVVVGDQVTHGAPLVVRGSTATAVLLVATDAIQPRVNVGGTRHAPIDSSQVRRRRSILVAAGAAADRTRRAFVIGTDPEGSISEWGVIAQRWEDSGDPDRALRTRELARTIQERGNSAFAEPVFSNVEVLRVLLEADLAEIDPATVEDPLSLVALAADASGDDTPSAIGIAALRELVDRGDIYAAREAAGMLLSRGLEFVPIELRAELLEIALVNGSDS